MPSERRRRHETTDLTGCRVMSWVPSASSSCPRGGFAGDPERATYWAVVTPWRRSKEAADDPFGAKEYQAPYGSSCGRDDGWVLSLASAEPECVQSVPTVNCSGSATGGQATFRCNLSNPVTAPLDGSGSYDGTTFSGSWGVVSGAWAGGGTFSLTASPP